ncbi:MAG: UDP-N-acetylmuramoyl-L-alanine--D-glutamate ligase, partial [Clostridia bacterium]|nr:UDP-N-acetylmuramoyl-L-alanine--D-glutamate ligase [Clostridia bacterium]
TKIWLGGNIGTPLIAEIGNIRETDRVVLELSSFQLMTLSVSPHVAVITNITPNHLDVHKDYQEYIDAKCRIYAQRSDCRVVLNAGCPETLEIGMDLIDAGHPVDWFSAKLPTMSYPEGYGQMAYYMNDWIYVKGESEVISLDREGMLLPGIHNVENLMAAVCACGDEISQAEVVQVAGTFGGVAHRLELVRKINGVPYYNSSIDSSPNRTINALSVFKGNVVLIAGGKDKGIPYDAIGPAIVEKVKTLILVGATADKIEAALCACDSAETVKIIHCDSYPEAVQCAYEAAVPGDTVLLSPASTSFDRFKNFEERGNVFKTLVLALPS